jgi:UPF0755 protein
LNKNKVLAITSTALLLVFLVVFGIYLDLIFYSDRTAGGQPLRKIITIKRGQSFAATTQYLYREGLIKSPFRFRLLARVKGADKRIQAGEYLLSSELSPNKILETMVVGKVRLYKFTVPEGYNLKQIAEIISSAGFVTQEEFLKAATDPIFVRQMNIPAETFEGYLFPDTYYFPKGASAPDLITAMVERMNSLFSDQWKQRAAEIDYSIHEVLTLASIIEKETGASFERPLISSVFHNRLRKGMRLETDPTVIYGLKNFDGNLTRKDLRTPTPYNTYKIKGLPPGPIASPGLAAIEAALYPAESDYLFFVSKKDSTHKFSTNFKDHEKAIRKYQLRRRKKRK